MNAVIHYFSGMTMFLAIVVFASMWLASIIISLFENKFLIALVSFFLPPVGAVYMFYVCLLESKGLDHLSGKTAFKKLILSFRKEDKCILKQH